MSDKKILRNYFIIAIGAFALGFAINIKSDVSVASCSVYFSPGDPCEQKIVEEIRNAKREILVQTYSFTSNPIAEALILAYNRGIRVVCIVDHSQENKMLILKLYAAKIPVFIDHPIGIAHNKVMIIDDKTVLTGSYNFTNAAKCRNVENSVHIISEKIASEYKRQWYRRLKLSRKLDPKINYEKF